MQAADFDNYTGSSVKTVANPTYQAVDFAQPTSWCSIGYHELEQRIKIFDATKLSINIDGFNDPCSTNGFDPSSADRFCLGLLSNIYRNRIIKQTRQHIGKGIHLFCVGGEVFVECQSESSIFVQSRYSNMHYGWHPASICKVPPGCRLCVFNNKAFANLLTQRVKQGFEAVYQLISLCTINISFVKGWSIDPESCSQTITSMPCWVDININGPLKWLDKVLTLMGSSNQSLDSDS